MMLQLLAVLVLGLMCGSEFNVAAFAHPTLNQQPQKVHAIMRSSLASLLGRVMPFWMIGAVLLNVLLLLPFEHLDRVAWQVTAIALTIQVLVVVFSLIGPVPIADPRAPVGSLSLVKDRCAGCRVRTAGVQRWGSLGESAIVRLTPRGEEWR